MNSFRLSDLERRLSNVVSFGMVSEIDYEKSRVRVVIGKNTTAWLPWMTSRASTGECTWNPPEVGEQVVVLSPSGELAAGIVLPGGIYKNDRPANGDKATISRTTYADGAVIEYDREKHEYSIKLPAEGKATIKSEEATLNISQDGIRLIAGKTSLSVISGGIIIQGTVTINGSVTQFKGPLKSNNVSLHAHTHVGITPGTGTSGPPVPA